MKGWNWKAWPKLFMASVAADGSIFGVLGRTTAFGWPVVPEE